MFSFCSLLLLASTTEAFLRPATIRAGATPLFSTQTTQAGKQGGIAGELGTPCEDECAMMSYPNLPPSVHPGVLSGQAMMDLLNHAKENGKSFSKGSSLCLHAPILEIGGPRSFSSSILGQER